MKPQRMVGANRFLDREARELVAEGHRAVLLRQHTGAEAFAQRGERLRAHRFQQPELRLWWRDCDHVEQRACLGRQTGGAGEHRIPHGGRDLLCAGRRQDFGDEERVAGRFAKEVLTVDAGGAGHRRDRREGQRMQLDPNDRVIVGQLSQQKA